MRGEDGWIVRGLCPFDNQVRQTVDQGGLEGDAGSN